MPRPNDQALYQEARDFIMSKYKKNSAFASGAIVKHYKQQFKKKSLEDFLSSEQAFFLVNRSIKAGSILVKSPLKRILL